MNSKKKVAIAISSLAMLILAAIIAVVAVLAAQQGVFKTQVSVTYDADIDVLATIKASYQMQGSSSVDLEDVVFDGGENEEESRSVGNLSFERGSREFVIFTYKFTNSSSYDDFTAELSFTDGAGGNGTVVNMELTAEFDGEYEQAFSSGTLDKLTIINVSKGETKTFSLKVKLDNPAEDADFIGIIQWKLSVV